MESSTAQFLLRQSACVQLPIILVCVITNVCHTQCVLTDAQCCVVPSVCSAQCDMRVQRCMSEQGFDPEQKGLRSRIGPCVVP